MSRQETTIRSDVDLLSFLPLQYQRQSIRLGLDPSGNIVCVAADLVAILGYRDAANALRMLDSDEQGYSKVGTPGGMQRVLHVTESGFYHLIFGSHRKEAAAFRRWVTEEILPTLRRTGAYAVPQVLPHTSAQYARPSLPAQLTLTGALPPPEPPTREHAIASWYLLEIFLLLRDTEEWLSNQEIVQRTGIGSRCTRAHTLYLLQVGMIERQEVFPRYLHRGSPDAARRNPGVYNRLCLMAETMRARTSYR